MTYKITTPQLGIIDVTATTTLAPGYANLVAGTGSGQWPQLGSTAEGTDTTYGAGRFIYLKGAASVVANTLVNWNYKYVAAPLTSTSNAGKPVAVALGTVGSATYGWFQIGGIVAVLKTAVKISPAQKVFVSGTTGRFFSTSTTGKLLMGAITANSTTIASATSTVLVMLPAAGMPVQQGFGTI